MYGFHFTQQHSFLIVTVVLPKLVVPAKRLLENGITLQLYGFRAFQVYKSNIEYEIRLMVDTNVIGCNWIECSAGKSMLCFHCGFQFYFTLRCLCTPRKCIRCLFTPNICVRCTCTP